MNKENEMISFVLHIMLGVFIFYFMILVLVLTSRKRDVRDSDTQRCDNNSPPEFKKRSK